MPSAEEDAWPNGDGMTSEYVVLWFHPNGDRERKFGDDEAKARRFAAAEDAAEWHPILLHRITFVTEEILPLTGVTPPEPCRMCLRPDCQGGCF